MSTPEMTCIEQRLENTDYLLRDAHVTMHAVQLGLESLADLTDPSTATAIRNFANMLAEGRGVRR